MRTQSLVVTRRCNQRCGFCDRVAPGSSDPTFAELVLRIDAAVLAGATRLVITGGEPLLRRDLVELVARARAAGVLEVELQTNATGVTPSVAIALRDAGVTCVAVTVVTSSPDTHREIVGESTRPDHVFRGIKACLDAGLPVQVRLPLARGVPQAASRIAGLVEVFPAIRSFVLAPIGAGERTLRPHHELSPLELAAELVEAADVAERRKVQLSLSPDHVVAPCLLDLPLKARRLLRDQLVAERAPLGAHVACAACALAPHCTLTSDQLARAAGARTPTPIADAKGYLRPGKSPGHRLRVLGAAEVEAFFHVDYDYAVDVLEPTSRIGVIYRCNQVCTFCELADMDVDLAASKVRAALDAARARGSRRVILTGGEPTLCADLVEHVRHARALGFDRIELQTNAVLLDKAERARALREAGLTHAQISLHGPDGDVSDRLTAAPGTHRRTLAGITNLLEQGVRCLLNHLIFTDNAGLLVDFVDMVDARWRPYRELLTIQFHFPRNEFVDRAEAVRHVPRYSDVAPLLCRAVDRARALGYRVHDLQDPTGIPALCILGRESGYLGAIRAQSEEPRFHAWESEWLTRVDACKECDAAGACMGIPRTYLALHGATEFSSLRRPLQVDQ